MRNKYSRYDNIFIGLAAGVAIPVMAYGILLMVNEEIASWSAENRGSIVDFRDRTLTILALCFNVIPMQWFRLRQLDRAMQGVIFPTIIYVIAWMYYYGMELL